MYKYYKDLCNSYQANSISKDKIKEKIKLIDNDIHISNMKRCNATMTTAMEEKYKVNYSAETIKNMLKELLKE